jgi:hypothetical protein
VNAAVDPPVLVLGRVDKVDHDEAQGGVILAVQGASGGVCIVAAPELDKPKPTAAPCSTSTSNDSSSDEAC